MAKRLLWRALTSLCMAAPLVANLQSSAPAHAGGLPTQLYPSALSAAEVQRLAQHANQRVIVLLRDQHPELPARGTTASARVAAVTSDQAPILGELAQLGAPQVRSFRLINAIAATVSPAEEARLAANPLVLGVVPDRMIRAPRIPQIKLPAHAQPRQPGPPPPGACSADPNNPLLEPQALQLTNTAFAPTNTFPNTPSAQSLLTNLTPPGVQPGAGVKVAYIADGLNPFSTEFVSAGTGKSVFIDYQDFSGDGPGALTTGGEAYGDASSIAAQGNASYDLNTLFNLNFSTPCYIKVEGVAPGASLIGLDIFGQFAQSFVSDAVQAIQYAVLADGVDVLNESFGHFVYPDNALDPIVLANHEALAAGVTVTVSSGDAGTTSTIASPASDPNVIAVGAGTQFRLYSQLGIGAFGFGLGGSLNNNISALSSGGFTQYGSGISSGGYASVSPRTVDLYAPGDQGWAACDPSTTYIECNGQPLEAFGGTSEAAPLVAGCAALMIQAYRLAHSGASPSPSLVKQILMSTAADQGIPAYEQGAGMLDCLKAVQAALSIHDANGSPAAQGKALLFSPTSLSAADVPNTKETFTINVTNTASKPQVLFPHLRTLSATPLAGSSAIEDLPSGSARTVLTFTVPIGAQRLDASMAWPLLTPSKSQDAATDLEMSLFDPLGNLAAYSLPQGLGQYAHVDVKNPSFGTWTALIFTPAGTPSAFSGNFTFSFSASRFVPAGSISPGVAVIPAGGSTAFTVTLNTPANPGDASDAVSFTSSLGATIGAPTPGNSLPSVPNSVPISLRAVVPVGSSGAAWGGTLLGGNGRGGAPGQTLTYPLNIPSGAANLSLKVQFADAAYGVEGFLIDPNGQPVDVQSNATNTLQFLRAKPQGGLWTFVLIINPTASGNEISEPFTASLTFPASTAMGVTAPTFPTTIVHGTSANLAIPITNVGASPENYFVDARLSTVGTIPLLSTSGGPLSLPWNGSPLFFLVPTLTTELDMAAEANVPVTFDTSPLFGSPDIPAMPDTTADNAFASDTAPEVAPGYWQVIPNELGPYPFGGGPPGVANMGAVATAPLFDTTITSTTGDYWQSGSVSALSLNPHAQGTINIVIAVPANAVKGTKLSGTLYIDTINPFTFSSDELFAIPYSYTVG